ncbi:hypothetical protein TNCV_278711 [Trichonephila clavipes]|nr:hypothetical protein TNCV_278711 [Trichonephila clavipes]
MPPTTLELRREQLRANYFIRAMSVPSHPLKPFALAIGLNRLYEARSFNIKPFSKELIPLHDPCPDHMQRPVLLPRFKDFNTELYSSCMARDLGSTGPQQTA